MYHSNKVLLVKTNLSGLCLSFLLALQTGGEGSRLDVHVGCDGGCCIFTVCYCERSERLAGAIE